VSTTVNGILLLMILPVEKRADGATIADKNPPDGRSHPDAELATAVSFARELRKRI
jgi:hypothetical protein